LEGSFDFRFSIAGFSIGGESGRISMNTELGGRRILMNGLGMILAGLVWGLVVPHTPYPRLALGAHIQFETNGMLFVIVAILLLKLPHRVGPKSIWCMLVSAWLTWLMALSEVANSWWGASQLLAISASQAGATGGAPWQEAVLKLTHISAGLSLILSFALLIVGFARKP
jgi:hydroxylaminobenzene mutase